MANVQRINDYPVVADVTDENAHVLALVGGELALVPPSEFEGPTGPDWDPASAPLADTYGDEFDYLVLVRGGVAQRVSVLDYAATEAEALAGTDAVKAITPATMRGVLPSIPVAAATGVAATDTANIQTVFTGAPDGSSIHFQPGTYYLNSTISATGKTLTVHAEGVTFIRTTDAIAFHFTGGYDTPIAVSAVAEVSATYDELTSNVTRLTLASTPSWTKGDIVKVYADDVIPGARPGSAGLEERVATYLTVAEVSGTTVYCFGRPVDTLTTNIRVARLPNRTAQLIGATIRSDATLMASTTAVASVVVFQALVEPMVRGVTIDSSPAVALAFAGCYGYSASDVVVNHAKNATASGQYGYGIIDQASAFGNISNYRAHRVRHAFTDATPSIATSTADPVSYGRTYGTTVTDSVCYHPAASAWDTHAASESVTFDNCKTYDGHSAFGLRGRRHRVIDGLASRCQVWGLNIFNETSGGESTEHYVKDFVADRVLNNPVAVDIHPTGHPSAGVRDTNHNATLDGITIRGLNNRGMHLSNCKVTVDHVKMVYANGTSATNAQGFYVNNSEVYGRDWVQDYRLVSAGSGSALVSMFATSILDVTGWDYLSTFTANGTVAHGIHSNSATTGSVRVRDWRLTHTPTTVVTLADLPDGSSVDWINSSDGANSSAKAFVGAAIEATDLALMVGRTRARDVVVVCQPDAARALPALKDGLVYGQRLWVKNTSGANTVTIRHGDATYNTTLDGSVDKVIAASGEAVLMWVGTTWVDATL